MKTTRAREALYQRHTDGLRTTEDLRAYTEGTPSPTSGPWRTARKLAALFTEAAEQVEAAERVAFVEIPARDGGREFLALSVVSGVARGWWCEPTEAGRREAMEYLVSRRGGWKLWSGAPNLLTNPDVLEAVAKLCRDRGGKS